MYWELFIPFQYVAKYIPFIEEKLQNKILMINLKSLPCGQFGGNHWVGHLYAHFRIFFQRYLVSYCPGEGRGCQDKMKRCYGDTG